MKIPRLQGLIRRRLLVNFRVDAEVMAKLVPSPFRPKLLDGWALAGICLIRLEQVRPAFASFVPGLRSENAAHRVAVQWTGDNGAPMEGVYIPRRDSNSLINRLVGGRLFPGEHHKASFRIRDAGQDIQFEMNSDDGEVAVALHGKCVDRLPSTSKFSSVQDASDFFEKGSLGYSDTAKHDHLDGLKLVTKTWAVQPLEVDQVRSSYFDDLTRFPKGSVEFDCALLMRNIEHEWLPAASLQTAHVNP